MSNLSPTLAALPAFVSNNMDWSVCGLIVVLGLLVYGFRDLLRTRLGRVWAISGVCFRDAIRRRVLWITPLAMLGILLVSQFQRPVDEQDAIRLTVKVCLFTTGLVVTIIALVTAATNLPREIENRVVFTIVTKPVTRLEIVLGKIVGFARVSAAMLLVMGVFSLVYLHGRAFFLGRQISEALQSTRIEETRKVWLTHYQEQGLLQSRATATANSLMVYARPPTDDTAGGWILGGAQDAIALVSIPDNAVLAGGLVVRLNVGYELLPTTDKTPPPAPVVAVQMMDPTSGTVVLSAEQLGKNASSTLVDPTGNQFVQFEVAQDRASQLAGARALGVQLVCSDGRYLYKIRPDAVTLIAADANGTPVSMPTKAVSLRGGTGRGGQQLSGPTRGITPVAVYAYRNAAAPVARNGQVPFELNVGVDRGGADSETEISDALEVRAYDRKDAKLSPPTTVYPESRRTVFFNLPADFVSSGDFDVQVRNRATGHTVSLTGSSVTMIADHGSFAVNLFKALLVLWLLAVLTATVAFWCSTFLSWPIAVVLTVLIILGHWGVSNVDLGSGIGAQVANDFFGNNGGMASVVNKSVETLSRTLTLLSSVLPDIGAFGVSDQIERGVTLSLTELAAPLKVLTVFGLPLITVAYVFLRNKEVAP